MADQPKSRGWGSLLSGAVAGLESKLDVILAEDPNASARSRLAEKEKKEREKQLKAEQDASRTPSRNRANERLQARLAQALNKSADGSRTGSGRSSLDVGGEKVGSLAVKDEKLSVDLGEDSDGQRSSSTCINPETKDVPSSAIVKPSMGEPTPIPKAGPVQLPEGISETKPSVELLKVDRTDTPEPSLNQIFDVHDSEAIDYLEKIDALHSKVSYLSSQLHANANAAAETVGSGTLEKKVAEQDAKIAQLIQEGEKLSHDQLKYSRAIKGLRSRVLEQDKTSAELRKKLDKAEAQNKDLQEQLKTTQAREKNANDKVSSLSKVEKDLANATAEKVEALNRIQALMKDLREADQTADDAMKNAQSGRLTEQMRLVSELNDELSNARIEKKLVEERAKLELKEVREAHQREVEKTKLSELELRTEVQNLEAKLEVLRLKSEEVSSSTTSDAQAKLLRQIETLQTQYSHASENWQSLESSLNNRITALEKERDDLAKREADVRKKSRETNSKARRLEEDLDASNDKTSTLESQLAALRSTANKLESKLKSAEIDAQLGKDALERSRKEFEVSLDTRLEDERKKIQAELASQSFSPLTQTESHPYLRTDSYPSLTPRKASTTEITSSQRRSRIPSADFSALVPSPAPESNPRPGSKRFGTGRGLYISNDISLTNKHSLPSPPLLINGGTPPIMFTSNAPSIHTIDHDERDDDLPSRDSPQRTIAELMSVSTAGAGPSVQLVERMSATVRKLEMEKAASREAMARLQGQRDEAREEIVTMMCEVDELKVDHKKMSDLEAQMQEVQSKFDHVLEMLGEKTERCEDLENDVKLWKNLYQEHLDSTTK